MHPTHERGCAHAGRTSTHNGPLLVPAGILAEIAYLIEQRLPHVLDAFLGDLESGALTIVREEDISRIRTLVSRYVDLPLGVADASVIACAERNGGRVATLHRQPWTLCFGQSPAVA